MNSVIENIKTRRSVRRYLNDQIKDEELEAILEAGSYAPSGHNEQSWYFTVIQNKEIIDYISSESKNVMASSEIDWIAKMGNNEKYHVLHNAPTVVIVSGRDSSYSPEIDCSAAAQNILLAAASLNIGSCWVGLVDFFFKQEEKVKKLNIPEGYTPLFAITLGYRQSDKIPKALERKKDLITYIK